jgi:hypothetical protein
VPRRRATRKAASERKRPGCDEAMRSCAALITTPGSASSVGASSQARQRRPMVLDIESKLNEKMLAKMTRALVLHYAEEFAGTVAERTGRDVMTYVSPGFMPELGNKAPAHWKDVWVAAFFFSHGQPPTPRGFSKDYVPRISSQSTARFRASVSPSTSMCGSAMPRAFASGSRGARARAAGAQRPRAGSLHEGSPDTPQADRLADQGDREARAENGTSDQGFPARLPRGSGDEAAPPDGLIGPRTEKALRWSAANGGACSKHFEFREFASSHSGWIRTHRELVIGLEKLRAHVGHPIGVLSGFRDRRVAPSASHEPAPVPR